MKNNGVIKFFVILLLPALLIGTFVAVLDPFFHYHGPIKGLPYTLSDERYQNDGILKHFDYSAMITGTSLTQNFKATDAERLWGLKTVKTSFAGATLRESGSAIKTALKHNKGLKLVIRDLDPVLINMDKDELAYETYPEYLYDSNPFNDGDYLFNEGVLTQIGQNVMKLLKRRASTSFDEYSFWADYMNYGKEAVLSTFTRIEAGKYHAEPLTDEDYARIKGNVEQNIVRIAKENPDVEFYVFVPPGSVVFWDAILRQEALDNTLNMFSFCFEEMFKADNIRIFAFDDRIDITGDLDNYTDSQHYRAEINTYILECMADGDGQITRDNYRDYLARVREIYENYDYDSLFE